MCCFVDVPLGVIYALYYDAFGIGVMNWLSVCIRSHYRYVILLDSIQLISNENRSCHHRAQDNDGGKDWICGNA